jgi:DNA-binding transcriptional MerR regulator
MKWFLPGKAMLNTHINLKSIKDILSEQQTNQEPDEAITQKLPCNEAIEHSNALQCFVESISEVPQQIWKTL